MGFFLKSISWSRRIVLKRLQDNSGSIKRRKVPRKKCWSYKFESFWGHFAIWAMHDTRRSEKNQPQIFEKKSFFEHRNFQNYFSPRKNVFFSIGFFLWSRIYLHFRFSTVWSLAGVHRRRYRGVFDGSAIFLHYFHFAGSSSLVSLLSNRDYLSHSLL